MPKYELIVPKATANFKFRTVFLFFCFFFFFFVFFRVFPFWPILTGLTGSGLNYSGSCWF